MSTLGPKTMRRLIRYRKGPVTVGTLIRANAALYAFVSTCLVLAGLLLFYAFGWSGAAAAFAFGLGVMSRDIAYFRQFVVVWPLVGRYIDWAKVEAATAAEPSVS